MVEKDSEQAEYWLSAAAESGDTEMVKQYKRFKRAKSAA
jgi:hypothetical protein